MTGNCSFRLLSSDGEMQTVVCVHCGRPVTLKDAASKHIVANCRGSQETRWKDGERVRATLPQGGAGTELKKMLAAVGIESTPNCACNRRAAEMDARGPDWCEENIDTIVGWLREEATKRNLPFLDAAGRLLVRRAIANARRAAAAN